MGGPKKVKKYSNIELQYDKEMNRKAWRIMYASLVLVGVLYAMKSCAGEPGEFGAKVIETQPAPESQRIDYIDWKNGIPYMRQREEPEAVNLRTPQPPSFEELPEYIPAPSPVPPVEEPGIIKKTVNGFWKVVGWPFRYGSQVTATAGREVGLLTGQIGDAAVNISREAADVRK